jgi:hypothetical protein
MTKKLLYFAAKLIKSMKRIFLSIVLLFSFINYSQENPCVFDIENVTDSTSVHVTKDFFIQELVLGSMKEFTTAKIFEVDGRLGLQIQYLQKNENAISGICIDKTSSVVLDINNGKQAKLIFADEKEICNDIQYDAVQKLYLRILTGNFYFTQPNFEDLLSNKVSMLTIKATTGDVNIVLKSTLESEIQKTNSTPDTFFIDTLKCFVQKNTK